MIIPTIYFNSQIDEGSLFKLARRWSLLGRICVLGIEPEQVSLFSKFVKKSGGSIDLQLELTEPNRKDALSLLNDGACEVISNFDSLAQLEAVIPNDRLIVKLDVADSSFETKLKTVMTAGHKVLVVGDPDSEIVGTSENSIQFASASPSSDSHDTRLINSRDERWQDCLVDVSNLASNPDLIADTIANRLKSDRADGLWPTIIADQLGVALGLAYSNHDSLRLAVANRTGVYWSRSRNEIWEKGKSSGATQQLIRIDLDCDRDCLRFTVVQGQPGFCHRDNYTCFGPQRTIQTVSDRLTERLSGDDEQSFTKKLATNPDKLRTKLIEEANELADTHDPAEVAWEAADLLYFSMVRMIDTGVELNKVFEELTRRLNRVVRRPDKLETQVTNES